MLSRFNSVDRESGHAVLGWHGAVHTTLHVYILQYMYICQVRVCVCTHVHVTGAVHGAVGPVPRM